jgi:uncharacterized protein GlcG (DUF336 family)
VIDPKSTAGVLLREHDNLLQAAEYAERKARTLTAMQNACGLDYAEAARQLRAAMAGMPDACPTPTQCGEGGA